MLAPERDNTERMEIGVCLPPAPAAHPRTCEVIIAAERLRTVLAETPS